MIDALNECLKVRDVTVGRHPFERLGEDGFRECGVCGKKLEKKIKIMGFERIVQCVCDCDMKAQKEHEKAEAEQDNERRRRICFSETNMARWNFDNDDRKNPQLSDSMKKYAEGFEDFRRDGKGLLLYGPCGTGKTFYAACIANELITRGYTVLMTNFSALTNKLSGMFEGKQEFINGLNSYSLLVIDDLGAERSTPYMLEQVFNIVDSRYRSGRPMIITTNLTADEIKHPQDVAYSRIYDRILERCFPVAVNGTSRRRQELRDSYGSMKERLGL